MKVEIELPDELKDKNGNLYEPTGEYRVLKAEEFRLNSLGIVVESFGQGGNPQIVLQPKWIWPRGLAGWGIAVDKNVNNLYWYEVEPKKLNDYWRNTTSKFLYIDSDIKAMIPALAYLAITDWTKPVLNPNYKAPEIESEEAEEEEDDE